MQKNVVFILTDDQTYQTINCLNNPEIITPNLDRLTKLGTTFTNAHIPSGTCGAVCMPSRAMIHSSKYVFDLEASGASIPAHHTLLGEVFKTNGYETFGCGKWHNGSEAYARSFTSGDNIFFGGMWDHYNVPMNEFDYTGEYDNHINCVVNFFQSNDVTKMQANKFNPGVHSTEVLSQTAVDFLANYHQEKPFFLYLAYLAPHDPRVMPDTFKDLYDVTAISLPENFAIDHPFDFGHLRERDELLQSRPLDPQHVKQEIRDYYAMITHLDHEIGKVLTAIESKGLMDDTYIVFTSDNGLTLGCHGLMGKQNHYEEAVRIPLIISGPNIRPNHTIDHFVYLLDIYPTLCELNDLPIPSSADGISFAGLLTATSSVPIRDYLYFAFNDTIRAYKDERYKLIYYRSPTQKIYYQLFDLIHDPYEKNNLLEQNGSEQLFAKYLVHLNEAAMEWERQDNPFSCNFWLEQSQFFPQMR